MLKKETNANLCMKDIAADHSNVSNNLQHTESKHKSKFEDLKKNMEMNTICEKLNERQARQNL